nr:hypothetical protein [Halomonas tianxiuensis]
MVDEWLAVLGQVIRCQWPQVNLRQHAFALRPSHDVDRPSRYGFARDIKLARVMLGDTLRHGRPRRCWSVLGFACVPVAGCTRSIRSIPSIG